MMTEIKSRMELTTFANKSDKFDINGTYVLPGLGEKCRSGDYYVKVGTIRPHEYINLFFGSNPDSVVFASPSHCNLTFTKDQLENLIDLLTDLHKSMQRFENERKREG